MGLFKLKEKIEKRVIEHRKKASAQILETGFKVDCNYCDQPATYICSKCGEETCDGCNDGVRYMWQSLLCYML